MGVSAFLKAFECDPIDAPIGSVDLEVNLYMTGDGYQFVVVNTADNARVRDSSTWADFYAD